MTLNASGTSTKKSPIALITGASSGIGQATARRLAGSGTPVVLMGRRRERLDDLASEITSSGGLATVSVGDVTRVEDVAAAVDAAGRMGHLGILVANAGIIPIEPLEDTELERWHRTIDTNLSGLVNCVHTVLPAMLEEKRGDIVLISSVAGRQTFPEASVYCATKAAVNHFADCLRVDLAKRCAKQGGHLRVSTIQPGIVQTELLESIEHEPTREAAKAFTESVEEPLLPEDIAETVAWIIESPPHVSINDVVIRPTAMTR